MRIAIFYHCVFYIDGKPLPAAADIVQAQMATLRSSGLLDEAAEMRVGVNGDAESYVIADSLLPLKAQTTFHGAACRNELRTLLMLEEFVREHDDEWLVFYFHSKGATKPTGNDMARRWRGCAMKHLVQNWRRCVKDLETVESVGCHFMTGDQTPPGQSIWAGNLWFSRASYLRTLPSVMERARIKESGIDALESRFEAEVWHFNGPRLPTLIDYHGPRWDPSKILTCAI